MVDLEWKAKNNMAVSPRVPTTKLHVSIPPVATAPFMPPPPTGGSPVLATDPACVAYEQYLRLPELKSLWSTVDFPGWENEAVLRPALHGLEITFRLVSGVLSDPRPYSDRRRWERSLESLAAAQVEIVSRLVEDEEAGWAPVVDLSSSGGVLSREGSFAEVWKGEDATAVVNHISEGSLLPRLATWHKSERVAEKILFSIECGLRRCPYTLGLGEPNLSGKPSLDYDAVCRPTEINTSLKRSPTSAQLHNPEDQAVHSTLQILECWVQVGKQILNRHVINPINSNRRDLASDGCCLLQKTWNLLGSISDLLLLTDPDDFLKLKAQLLTRPADPSPLCFRSRALVDLTKSCKELKHTVPGILGVEVDPLGGPRVQEAAMRLYREGKRTEAGGVHLLQGMQGVEKAVKGFYYGYKQVMVAVMGSVEGNGTVTVTVTAGDKTAPLCWVSDPLGQLFMEPTYFPSLDAAKTFIGDSWWHEFSGGARRSQ